MDTIILLILLACIAYYFLVVHKPYSGEKPADVADSLVVYGGHSHNKSDYIIGYDPINKNLPTIKNPPPLPPRPVYKEPVSRGGWSSSKDPRKSGNSDIADDLLLNPLSLVSIWQSSDDSSSNSSSSWDSSDNSSSSYDSGSYDSGDSGGGSCD